LNNLNKKAEIWKLPWFAVPGKNFHMQTVRPLHQGRRTVIRWRSGVEMKSFWGRDQRHLSEERTGAVSRTRNMPHNTEEPVTIKAAT